MCSLMFWRIHKNTGTLHLGSNEPNQNSMTHLNYWTRDKTQTQWSNDSTGTNSMNNWFTWLKHHDQTGFQFTNWIPWPKVSFTQTLWPKDLLTQKHWLTDSPSQTRWTNDSPTHAQFDLNTVIKWFTDLNTVIERLTDSNTMTKRFTCFRSKLKTLPRHSHIVIDFDAITATPTCIIVVVFCFPKSNSYSNIILCNVWMIQVTAR